MEKLIEVAIKESIEIIENATLPKSYLGLYTQREGERPTISLSKKIFGKHRLSRCIMAEELGHHFTTPAGTYLPRKIIDYRVRLFLSKAEYKAARWGALFLIPVDKLKYALQALKLHTLWELADYFEVTQEVMGFRWKLLKKLWGLGGS